jgi:hypothetical protein
MPEAMLLAVVLVLCSERGRSERWSARHEHGAKYASIDGLPVAAAIRPGTVGYPSSRDDDAGDVPIARWVEPL